MDSELLTVYKYGTYYNPAWKHYGGETNVFVIDVNLQI